VAIIHGPDAWKPRIVELKERPVVFGRIASQYQSDVALPGPTVARRLFEIRWNTKENCHEVQDYGQVYPPSLNGEPLKPEECRLLSIGDVLTIDRFRIRYTAWQEEQVES